MIARIFALVLKFGSRSRTQKSQGIEIALQVPPLPVSGEYTFPFRVGAILDSTVQNRARSLVFRGHKSAASRITDAAKTQKLQPHKCQRRTRTDDE